MKRSGTFGKFAQIYVKKLMDDDITEPLLVKKEHTGRLKQYTISCNILLAILVVSSITAVVNKRTKWKDDMEYKSWILLLTIIGVSTVSLCVLVACKVGINYKNGLSAPVATPKAPTLAKAIIDLDEKNRIISEIFNLNKQYCIIRQDILQSLKQLPQAKSTQTSVRGHSIFSEVQGQQAMYLCVYNEFCNMLEQKDRYTHLDFQIIFNQLKELAVEVITENYTIITQQQNSISISLS